MLSLDSISFELLDRCLGHALRSTLAACNMLLVKSIDVLKVVYQIENTLHKLADQIEVHDKLKGLKLYDCSTLLQLHRLLPVLLFLF